jgi:hypothetical protein
MSLVFNVASPSYISNIGQQLTTNWISIGAVAPELPNNLVGFVRSFEIKAHLAAREATRALDLIHRAWGWYLNHPDGTASTCIEGYLADGSSWQLSPQFGVLTHAERGFTSPLGKFSARWTLIQGGYMISWGALAGMVRTVTLPAATTRPPSVVLDGNSRPPVKGSYNATTGLFTISGGSGSHSAKVIF